MNFRQKALRLCHEMRVSDDRLGRYADYEGDEEGATFHLWEQGVEAFDAQCKAAIKQHAVAIAIWKKFAKLNRLRAWALEAGFYETPDADAFIARVKKTLQSINGAVQRCTNPKNIGFPDYGARGIIVCEHWHKSYGQFLRDMGLRPEGLSLDRIDNDKGYLCPKCCPPNGNCQWADWHQQRVNQRPRRKKEVVRTARGEIMAAWWAKQNDEYKKNRLTNARATGVDGLVLWRAKKTTVCLRCGYAWAKTKKSRTRVCPKCLSPNWDVLPSPPEPDSLLSVLVGNSLT